MKKLTALLLSLIFLLSIAACTNKNVSPIQSSTKATTKPGIQPPGESELFSKAGIKQEPYLSPAFMDVLTGKKPFFNAERNEEQYLWDYQFWNACSLLDETRSYITIIDMDHDGQNELIFCMIDNLILREENGKIYGYGFTFREMEYIYSDGSFSPHDTVEDGGTLYTIEFLENGKYEFHLLCKRKYVDGETINYVGDKQVSDAEFEKVYAEHVNTGWAVGCKLSEFSDYDARYKDTINSLYRIVGFRLDSEFEYVYNNYGFIPTPDSGINADTYEFSCMLVELTNGCNDLKMSDYYFGFADLNQDDVLELLFYRRDGYIHAVFTIVDGMPKMVDAFWSERWAKITESGDIMIFTSDGPNVSVSVVKLIANSTEYELVEEFGTKGSAETNTQYYQVADDTQVIIDEQKFDELCHRDLYKIQFPIPVTFENTYYNRGIGG